MYDLEDWQITVLTQRLTHSPDLLTSMLGQNPTPAETLMKQAVLYVNKVGGYYPDPTNEIIAIKEHECIYDTHKNVAFNRDITDDKTAIYFTCAVSPITNKHVDCTNLGIKEPTNAQRKWLKTYKHQLSPTQRKNLAKYL